MSSLRDFALLFGINIYQYLIPDGIKFFTVWRQPVREKILAEPHIPFRDKILVELNGMGGW
jgi:hypothetical protein